MIYLSLFLNYLKIGAISFGGGYGIVSVYRDTFITEGWFSEDEFLNFLAVSESTPGPISINMATFMGAAKGGVLGAVLATLGLVLPAFLIILFISSIMNNLTSLPIVRGALGAIRPCVVALILSTSITMGLGRLANPLNIKGIILLIIIGLIDYLYKRIKNSKMSPIFIIIIAGLCGIIFF